MRRHLAVFVVVAAAAAACGGDEGSTTSTLASTTASQTTAPIATTEATTAVPATSTTVPPTTTATTTSAPPRSIFAGSVALMLGTGPAEWESVFIDPGGVIYHDGTFHSFYNGIDGWPKHVRVGYATSLDGRDWEKQSDEWLFTGEGLDWTELSIFVHDVIVLDDGTWAMYFSTVETQTNFANGVIGMATAPGPTGPWTAVPDPVLEKGPEGAWDATGVVDPSVVRRGDEYWMYFDGNNNSRRSIGVAMSDDGFTWTKYDDPATTDPEFAASDPVLVGGAEGEFAATGVYDPQVVLNDEGFVMSFFTRRPGTSAPIYEAGLAYSDDGLTWEKDPLSPYLSSERYGFGGIFLSSLVHHDGEYFLYFDAQDNSGQTTAFFVRHEGVLRP